MKNQIIVFNEKSKNTINLYSQNEDFQELKGLLSLEFQKQIGVQDLKFEKKELDLFLEKLNKKLRSKLLNFTEWQNEKSVDGYIEFEGTKYPVDIRNDKEKKILNFYTIYLIAKEASESLTSFIICNKILLSATEVRILITIARKKEIEITNLLAAHNYFFNKYLINESDLKVALVKLLKEDLIFYQNATSVKITQKGFIHI